MKPQTEQPEQCQHCGERIATVADPYGDGDVCEECYRFLSDQLAGDRYAREQERGAA